jgi:hypothetical protein
MQSQQILAALILVSIFLSGCIVGGDRISTAKEMASLREQAVPAGLLAPTTSEGRQHYRDALIGLRSKVNGVGEGKPTLQAYLDGSLEAIAMQEELNDAFMRLKQVNQEALNCASGSPADQAMQQLQSAQEKSTAVHASFSLVQRDVTLTNALGADYVTNAAQTTENISSSIANTLEQIRQNCV